jgi:signal transduction histidine kinase/CheY-like chemotaxis protein
MEDLVKNSPESLRFCWRRLDLPPMNHAHSKLSPRIKEMAMQRLERLVSPTALSAFSTASYGRGVRRGSSALKALFTFILLACLLQTSRAQQDPSAEIGYPYIRNFSQADFNAPEATWATIRDRRGILYVGNPAGVLEFDGVSWRIIQTAKKSPVRTLIEDPQTGLIYAGSVGDFGYLDDPNKRGELEFVSLLQKLEKKQDREDLGDIYSSVWTPDGVFFLSHNCLLRLRANEKEIKVWRARTKFNYVSYVGGQLYVSDGVDGLQRLDHDSLVPVPGFRSFGDSRRLMLLPYDKDHILVADRGPDNPLTPFDTPLLLYDVRGGTAPVPYRTEANKILTEHRLVCGQVLRDGSVALGTSGGGLIILGRDGKLLWHLDRKSGLLGDTIYGVYQDGEALWVNLSTGLSRLRFPPPASYFGSESGIEGTKNVLVRHLGSIFVGTSDGVYTLHAGGAGKSVFSQIRGTENRQIVAMLSVKEGGEARLLLGTSSGLFELTKNNVQPIIATLGSKPYVVTCMVRSLQDPDRIFVGLEDGFASVHFTHGRWIDEGRFTNVSPRKKVKGIVEQPAGRLWLSTEGSGILRVDLGPSNPAEPLQREAQVKRVGQTETQGMKAFDLGGGVLFASSDLSRLYRLEEPNQFIQVPANDPLASANSEPAMGVFGFQKDDSGNIWTDRGRELVLLEKHGDSYTPRKVPFPNAHDLGALSVAFPEPNGVIWLGSLDRLVRYDSTKAASLPDSFNATVRRVTAIDERNSEQVLYGGHGAVVNGYLNSRQRSVRFEFASSNLLDDSSAEFQTFLEGADTNWSKWDRSTTRSYTRLPYQKLIFHVRARNFTGHATAEAQYTFTIAPPWYRTWQATLVYGLLVALGVWLAFRLQSRRMRAALEREQALTRTEALEAEVKLRTHEISQQAAELRKAYETVESLSEVGRQITASLDLDTVLDRVYHYVSRVSDASVFGVGMLNAEEHRIDYRLAIMKSERDTHHHRDTRDPNQFAVWCIENRQPVVMNNVEEEYNRYIETMDHELAKIVEDGKTLTPASIIYLPLITQGNVLGVITIQSFAKNAYSENDINILKNVASYTSIAIDNAQAYWRLNEREQQVQQQAAELATVNEVGRAAASELEVSSLLELVGKKIHEVFDAPIAYVALCDKGSGVIRFPYGIGRDFAPVRFGRGIVSRILSQRAPILINPDEEGRYPQGAPQTDAGITSSLGVPVFAGDEIVGVIGVETTDRERRFKESDLRLLTTIAASVGVNLHNLRLFDEAKEARAAAEAADAAKSDFLSTVSHELRTPLTSVLGFAILIRRRLLEKIFPLITTDDGKIIQHMQQVTDNLDIVVSEGERLTKLIDEVLDLSKLKAKKVEWRTETISASEIINRALAATSSLVENKPVVFDSEVDPDLPAFTGDRDRFIQVVINLISNAVKFTSQGKVTCKARRQDETLVISVTDTGLGIAAEDQPKVFEKFKQVGDTLTEKPKGTGLGLSICKEIVEHHGGTIWVESEPGRGSTFSFSVPLKVDRPAVATLSLETIVRRLRESVEDNNPSAGHEQSILVVDDDPHIRELLRQEFRDAGHQVRFAANGREAINSVREERPGLVVLDVMMPEMNGFDVAAVLRNDPATMDIPIIMLSIMQDKERGYRLGIDRYLTKPVDTDLLFREVETLMEQGKTRKKVMIVDEDATTVKTLSEVLQVRGYHVSGANPNDLVQEALSHLPDVIFMNSLLSSNDEIMQSLRFENGLENVLFLIYQRERESCSARF